MRSKQTNNVDERKEKSLASKSRSYLSDLRTTFKDPDFRKRSKYASYWKRLKIKENQVLYESFYGRGMLCNPRALFLALLEDPRAKNMKHIWVLDDLSNHQLLLEEYKNFPNVSFVQFQSDEYQKALCTSKYVINNSTFPTYYTKKEGQIYINTWHGIPLKKMGFDLPNGRTESANVIRNFFHADYLISASPFLTEMYKISYKLEGIFSGRIVEGGYPRLDTLFRFPREEVFAKLRRYGVEVDSSKKILLYAPTLRGETYAGASVDISAYRDFKAQVEQNIDTSKYQILVKVHQRIFELYKDELKDPFFVPAFFDADEILSIADILLTDFSSIYFDYLATGRPVFFYIPDLEDYLDQRGLYKTIEQLPGPATKSIEELTEWINNIDTVVASYHDKYIKEREWANAVTDGQVSRRIVDSIFFGNDDACPTLELPTSEKKKILIYINIKVNGITTSFLNLLHILDYKYFDVSVAFGRPPEKSGYELIDEIPSEVRVLYRRSTHNMTRKEYARYRRGMIFGFKRYDDPAYRREFARSFGDASFDYVIDFDGYNRLYSLLALQDPQAKTAIWMHSDMYAEYEIRFPSLAEQFRMYSYFDYLISCSKEIMKVNLAKLADRYGLPKEKFRYAKNCMDALRVEEDLYSNPLTQFKDKRQILVNESTYYGRTTARLVPYVPERDEVGNKNFRFVTVGRMSPEKNQLNLIEAFDKLHQEIPNTVLYIVGDGPLRDETRKTIRTVPSKDAIVLTYRIPNPFAVMKYCDCFVLPSLHEGQGLVVLEARALHMPIIVSNFDCVDSVSLKNGQLVIGTEVEDIYEGLKAFTEGKVPSNYEFDMVKYNEEAYQEFLIAIGEIAMGGGALQ